MHLHVKQITKKLFHYKIDHPNFDCIYAVINDRHKRGQNKLITINNIQIRYLSGQCLLQAIFKKDTTQIVKILQDIIDTYLHP